MSVPDQTARELSFVHIPKNAGTSIKRAIAEYQLPILVSGHPYPCKLSDREIVVLRCPVDRFVSAFNYGRKYWPSPINSQFADANELASSAADPEHPKHALARIELGNQPEHYLLRNGQALPPQTIAGRIIDFPWVYEPQSSWLLNDPSHILRYRHLAEDFSALLGTMGLPDVATLPMANRSEGGDVRISDQALAFLHRTYAADFEFIRSRGLDV